MGASCRDRSFGLALLAPLSSTLQGARWHVQNKHQRGDDSIRAVKTRNPLFSTECSVCNRDTKIAQLHRQLRHKSLSSSNFRLERCKVNWLDRYPPLSSIL